MPLIPPRLERTHRVLAHLLRIGAEAVRACVTAGGVVVGP